MKFYEEQIETKTVYKGIVVDVTHDVVKLSNGNLSKREVVVHPGGVGIVPLTDDNKVIMVRQYRYCLEEEMIEIPAGKLEYGEDPFECAVRELSEETGCTAGRFVELGKIYPSVGFCKETLYLYLALDLKRGEMHLDDNELLSIEEVDIDELIDQINSNKMCDAKSIVGILKAKMYLDSLG